MEHPLWQFQPGEGTRKVICVGSHSKANFEGLMKPQTAETAPKGHLIICDVPWDPWGGSAQDVDLTALTETVAYENTDRNEPAGLFMLPLQGALVPRPAARGQRSRGGPQR